MINFFGSMSSVDRRLKTLENLYEKSQKESWDSEKYLEDLIALEDSSKEKYKFDTSTKTATKEIIKLLLYGEFVAWETSAVLSNKITFEEAQAKMAAASQTYDEIRHVKALTSYCSARLGIKKEDIPKELAPSKVIYDGLNLVKNQTNLIKQLIGMQLMVEPVAISLLSCIKKSEKADPVLRGLCSRIIQDEARHIALGQIFTPALLIKEKKSGYLDMFSIIFWQSRLLLNEMNGLASLEKHLSVLDIDIEGLYQVAKHKQLDLFYDVYGDLIFFNKETVSNKLDFVWSNIKL